MEKTTLGLKNCIRNDLLVVRWHGRRARIKMDLVRKSQTSLHFKKAASCTLESQSHLHNTLGPDHVTQTHLFLSLFSNATFLSDILVPPKSLKVHLHTPSQMQEFPSAEAFTQSFQSSRLSVISWHKSGHRSEEYCWIAYTSPRIEQNSWLLIAIWAIWVEWALFRKTYGVSALESSVFQIAIWANETTSKPITWLLHAASKIQHVLQQNQSGSTDDSWFLQHCSAKGAKSHIFSVKKSLSGFGGRPLMSSSPTPLARRWWGRRTAVVSPCLDFTCKIEIWKVL